MPVNNEVAHQVTVRSVIEAENAASAEVEAEAEAAVLAPMDETEPFVTMPAPEEVKMATPTRR